MLSAFIGLYREVKYATCPDKPGSPKKPYIKGKIHAHRVKIGWGK